MGAAALRPCRFGPVTILRRLYRDAQGEHHFLLDEYLGWDHQAAMPSLQEVALHLTAAVSFREAAKALEKVTAGVISPSTLCRLVRKTAEKAVAQEREEVEACFGRGRSRWRGNGLFPGFSWKPMGFRSVSSGRRSSKGKSVWR